MSLELIIPFLRPIAKYLAEEEVSEVMVNAGGQVFIERHGRLWPTEERIPEAQRESAARNIARVLGGDIGIDSPLLNARLPDGSRVAAVVPPISVGGTILAIRKFRSKVLGAEQLVERGMLSSADLGSSLGRDSRAPDHPHLRGYRHRQDNPPERLGGLPPARGTHCGD